MDFTRDTFGGEDFGNAEQDLFTFADPATLGFDYDLEPEYLQDEANNDRQEGNANIGEEGGEGNIDEQVDNLPTEDDNRALLDPQVAAADAQDAAIDEEDESKKIILEKKELKFLWTVKLKMNKKLEKLKNKNK